MSELTKLEELNVARVVAFAYVQALGAMNQPWDYEDRLKANAQYKLAYDTWTRAEREFQDEIARIPTADLMRLAHGAKGKTP